MVTTTYKVSELQDFKTKKDGTYAATPKAKKCAELARESIINNNAGSIYADTFFHALVPNVYRIVELPNEDAIGFMETPSPEFNNRVVWQSYNGCKYKFDGSNLVKQ